MPKLKPKLSGRKPSENKRMRKPDIKFVCQAEQKQPKRMDETTEPQNIQLNQKTTKDQLNQSQPTIPTKQTKNKARTVEVDDPSSPPEIKYELHLRSMVPRIVQKCQGYCQRSLIPADHKDYFLVKSFARSYYMHNGKKLFKVAPQYIQFNEDCLKEYTRQKIDTY